MFVVDFVIFCSWNVAVAVAAVIVVAAVIAVAAVAALSALALAVGSVQNEKVFPTKLTKHQRSLV